MESSGAKPEELRNMRYWVWMLPMPGAVDRRVPWLVVDVGECTLDCDPLGAHPGAMHRAGCGVEPIAPIHELRVAKQHHDRWKAQCARASALVGEGGNRVVAVGGDTGDVRASGEALGYADWVATVIRTDDGQRLFWNTDLVHPADEYTPECQAEREGGDGGRRDVDEAGDGDRSGPVGGGGAGGEARGGGAAQGAGAVGSDERG